MTTALLWDLVIKMLILPTVCCHGRSKNRNYLIKQKQQNNKKTTTDLLFGIHSLLSADFQIWSHQFESFCSGWYWCSVKSWSGSFVQHCSSECIFGHRCFQKASPKGWDCWKNDTTYEAGHFSRCLAKWMMPQEDELFYIYTYWAHCCFIALTRFRANTFLLVQCLFGTKSARWCTMRKMSQLIMLTHWVSSFCLLG